MKTIVKASSEPLSWYFLPDSALVNSGKPFFIPEFADEFEAILVPVVRINRIGKSIAARFAERYYSEIAPGVHFRAPKLQRKLTDAGLPPDPAYSFDRSLTVGSFMPADSFLNGDPLVMTLTAPDDSAAGSVAIESRLLKEAAGHLLEAVSATNTIKMGDYLLPLLSRPLRVAIGDTVSVDKGAERLLSIQIR